MAQPLNEFLIEYFKLVRMVDMRDNHTEQWAHFEDLVTSGDMTKDQKKWADKLFQKDLAGNFIRVNGEYQIKPLPDQTGTHDELDDADWETLFRICQGVFYNMSRDRASFAGNDKVLEFLNEWQHVFTGANQSEVVATAATEAQCAQLQALLTNNKDFLKDKLERDSDWAGILDSNTSYESLISGLASKKYNKDDKFREKIQTLAGKINNACDPYTNPTGYNKFISNIGGTRPNLRLIYDIYAPGWTQPSVDVAKLAVFKEQYQSLFYTLYKEDKVLDAFRSKEGSDNRISASVEGAKKGIDYDDVNSKNYVSPKRDDLLTPFQQLQKWADDTYENCLEKYMKLRGDRLFFSEYSQKIAKALGKNNVKPTDGFKGLLDNKSKIAGALKSSPKASEAFDWMSKTLEEFSNDPNLKRTMEGALKNGRQMRNLISELIIKAVDDNKVDQAKIAMEVLSVMKYGMTTSKVMDALKKEEISVFSDKNLSWNKNEGVQFVTKALDKSIKTAFMGIGYGITMIGNEIRLTGSKYNKQFQHGKKDKTGGKLRTMSNAHDANAANERAIFNANKTAADAADNARKAAKETDRGDALADLGLGRTDPDAKDKVDQAERNIRDNLKPELANKQTVLQPYTEKLDIYESVRTLFESRTRNQNELATLQTELAAATDPAEQEEIKQEIKLLSEDIRKNKQQIASYDGIYPELVGLQTLSETDIDNLVTTLEADPAYTAARDDYDNAEAEIYKQENAIDQFRKAEAEIKNLDDALKKRQKKFDEWDKDHKNKYEELISYWDILETGRDSHSGKMYSWAMGYKKAKHKAFSANANTYITNFISNYGHVA